jgi:hypothetical protein
MVSPLLQHLVCIGLVPLEMVLAIQIILQTLQLLLAPILFHLESLLSVLYVLALVEWWILVQVMVLAVVLWHTQQLRSPPGKLLLLLLVIMYITQMVGQVLFLEAEQF